MGAGINTKRLKLDKFPILSAIVVFESTKAKDVCLKAYERFAPKYTVNCLHTTPLDFLFKGHFHLEVTNPPEPFAIYWENYR